jgi:hypothetical protein
MSGLKRSVAMMFSASPSPTTISPILAAATIIFSVFAGRWNFSPAGFKTMESASFDGNFGWQAASEINMDRARMKASARNFCFLSMMNSLLKY